MTRSLFSLLIALLLVSECLCYTAKIEVSSSDYHPTLLNQAPTKQFIQSGSTFTVQNSPTTINFGFTKDTCNVCFACGTGQHTAKESGILYMSISYSSSYYTVHATLTKTVCYHDCTSSSTNNQNYQYGIPQYYYNDFVTLTMTVSP